MVSHWLGKSASIVKHASFHYFLESFVIQKFQAHISFFKVFLRWEFISGGTLMRLILVCWIEFKSILFSSQHL